MTTTKYDDNTRAYLLALKSGQKPETRPECGPQWSPLVDELERSFVRAKGDVKAIERVFAAQCKLRPALDELLKSPLQGGIEANELGVPALPESARLPADLSKGACPQLDRYVAHSKKASPEAYEDVHPFIGLWAFSAVANRRIYLSLGENQFFPNLMIQYCGESTFFAKSHTAKIGQNMLKRAGLGFLLFADKRMTPQKLLLEMTGQTELDEWTTASPQKQDDIRMKVAFAGQKVLYYDEFGKMLKEVLSGRSGAMGVYESLFLEMYNTPDSYSNGTVLRGMSPVSDPFLSILGSMVPANLRVIAAKGAESWGDGLFARNVFLAPDDSDIRHETLKFERLETPFELVREVRMLHERLGCPEVDIQVPTDEKGKTGRPTITIIRPLPQQEFVLGEGVEPAHDRYRIAIRKMAISPSVPHDLRASYGRLPESAIKFALVMAAMENDTNRVEMRHWARAQELIEIARYNLHKMYAQVNTPVQVEQPRALQIELDVERTLARVGALTLNTLKNSYFKNKYSIEELQKALRSLERAGTIEVLPAHGSKKFRIKPEQQEDEADGSTEQNNGHNGHIIADEFNLGAFSDVASV